MGAGVARASKPPAGGVRSPTAYGVYDGDLVCASERRAPSPDALWRIRRSESSLRPAQSSARSIVRDNDRPGVMSADAALVYLSASAVLVGKRVVIATNNDSAYAVAEALPRRARRSRRRLPRLWSRMSLPVTRVNADGRHRRKAARRAYPSCARRCEPAAYGVHDRRLRRRPAEGRAGELHRRPFLRALGSSVSRRAFALASPGGWRRSAAGFLGSNALMVLRRGRLPASASISRRRGWRHCSAGSTACGATPAPVDAAPMRG